MSEKYTYQELEQKLNEIERVIDLSLDMVGFGNLAGYFTKINSSFGRILGYTNEEFLATPFLDFVHSQDLEKTKKALNAAANGQKEIFVENRYICKDGSIKWIDWKVVSISEEDLFFAVGRDITKRKNIEGQLKESASELTAIIESSPCGITISDLKGQIIRTNPAHQRIFGYSLAELQTKTFADFTHTDDIGKNLELYEKLLAGDIEQCAMNKRFIHRDGHTVWTQVKLSIIKDESNKPLFIVGIVEDITVQKKEEMAKDALIVKLQNSMEEIKALQGIIPICMHCKQIRDDKGFWNRVEKYIEQHTEAKFSHGICPSCLNKFHPNLATKDKK